MAYCVQLDIFRGPLDLLLYLVRKNELDIFDIPIARVTQQYLEYLGMLQMIDVDVAGDFLVMAATLMEIKSRMLLPQDDTTDGSVEDPRMQLVRQLLEYKRFRDAAERLQSMAETQRSRFCRVPAERPGEDDPASEPIRDVELWDLVSAFGRLMRQTLAMAPKSIVYDETPIQVHMAAIMARLARQQSIAFSALFVESQDRGRVVGVFLALLELVKSRKVHAEQNEPFGEIWILPASPDADAAPDSTDPTAADLTTVPTGTATP